MQAEFQQLRNDLFWNFCDYVGGEFKYLKWQGYNDAFWWNKVSVTDQWQIRDGYRLNPETNEVTKLT